MIKIATIKINPIVWDHNADIYQLDITFNNIAKHHTFKDNVIGKIGYFLVKDRDTITVEIDGVMKEIEVMFDENNESITLYLEELDRVMVHMLGTIVSTYEYFKFSVDIEWYLTIYPIVLLDIITDHTEHITRGCNIVTNGDIRADLYIGKHRSKVKLLDVNVKLSLKKEEIDKFISIVKKRYKVDPFIYAVDDDVTETIDTEIWTRYKPGNASKIKFSRLRRLYGNIVRKKLIGKKTSIRTIEEFKNFITNN